MALIIGFIFTATLLVKSVDATTVSNLVDFNNTSDLTNLFNPSTGHTFTNIGASGISDSGSINVPAGSSDIWTTKQGYSVSGTGDKYTFSAFFKNKGNSGFGGLGFSNAATNEPVSVSIPVYTSTIAPATGIGVIFHGGGGYFVNNASDAKTLNWNDTLGDLVPGNWYKMVFVVTAKGSNTYDLDLQIWNSDANGNLGALFTEQTQNDVVNADMGSASIIHGYFSAASYRMEKIDNFLIQLEGGASFVEAGLPVVLTDSITNITSNSATSGGNVTDGQGQDVVSRGVCWSTSPSPLLNDNRVIVGSGLGAYTGNLTGLSPSTTYYVRAYAFNSSGTSYGSEYSFTTSADSTSSNNSSSGSSSVSDYSCHNSPPVLIPDLFQINTTGKTAKLFFTPIDTNQFYISFSTKPNAEEHGELVSLLKEGVQSETVYYLKPNTTYYFKVRGQNGCMSGNWSNIMKVTTNGSIFYKNYSPVLMNKLYSVSAPVAVPSIQPPIETQSPQPTSLPQTQPQPFVTPVAKKSCFLWWCN